MFFIYYIKYEKLIYKILSFYIYIHMPSKVSNFYPLTETEDIYENFSSTIPIIEHGVALSTDVANSSSTSIQNSKSESVTNTNTSNTTENTNLTDNSMQSTSNVKTNTTIDSSQDITNITQTNNRSEQNITSNTDTYNIDSSILINENKNSTMNKLNQTCGMSLQGAQDAVNIVENNSINTNVDVSNTFIVTGDSSTITDVELLSVLDYEGPDVDRKCVLDSVGELETGIKAINENAKAMEGGVGGDTGAKTGGNTTANDNSSGKADTVDGSVDATQTTANESTTENTGDTTGGTENTIVSETGTSQGAVTSATATAGFAIGGTLLLLILAFFAYKVISNQSSDADSYEQYGGLVKLVYKLKDL